MINLKIHKRVFNPAYYPYLWDNTRYLHFYGGSGSGKSIFVAQKLVLESFKTQYDVLVLRKVEKTVRESVYKALKQTIYQFKLNKYFRFYKSPAVIENIITGSRFVFAGLDDPEKVKSIAGIQKIWLEEATEMNLDDYLELDRRLRGLPNLQIIFSYNPIDENHWIKVYFHNSPPENCAIVKTTYLDNFFIDPEYKATLDRLKDIDENQWRIYALGEWGIQDLNHKFDILKVTALVPQDPISIIDSVKVFRKPEKRVYSLGIDSSRGRQDGDYTSMKLRSIDESGNLLDIASYKGKADEQLTFRIAYNLAQYYNKLGSVYITPEVNNMGIYLVNKFKESDYPEKLQYKRYITDETKQRDILIPDYGFVTTSKTRPLMINELADLFNDGSLEVKDEDEKSEMINFVWNPKKNRFEAQEGAHDDLIFADALSVQGFKFIERYG